MSISQALQGPPSLMTPEGSQNTGLMDTDLQSVGELYKELHAIENSLGSDMVPPEKLAEIFKKKFEKPMPVSQAKEYLLGTVFRDRVKKKLPSFSEPKLADRMLESASNPLNVAKALTSNSPEPVFVPRKFSWYEGFKASFGLAWKANFMNSLLDLAKKKTAEGLGEITPQEMKQIGIDIPEPVSVPYAMKIIRDRRDATEKSRIVAQSNLGGFGHAVATLSAYVVDPVSVLLSASGLGVAAGAARGVSLLGGVSLSSARIAAFGTQLAVQNAAEEYQEQKREIRHGQRENVSYKYLAMAGTLGAAFGGLAGSSRRIWKKPDFFVENVSPGLRGLRSRAAHLKEAAVFGGQGGFIKNADDLKAFQATLKKSYADFEKLQEKLFYLAKEKGFSEIPGIKKGAQVEELFYKQQAILEKFRKIRDDYLAGKSEYIEKPGLFPPQDLLDDMRVLQKDLEHNIGGGLKILKDEKGGVDQRLVSDITKGALVGGVGGALLMSVFNENIDSESKSNAVRELTKPEMKYIDDFSQLESHEPAVEHFQGAKEKIYLNKAEYNKTMEAFAEVYRELTDDYLGKGSMKLETVDGEPKQDLGAAVFTGRLRDYYTNIQKPEDPKSDDIAKRIDIMNEAFYEILELEGKKLSETTVAIRYLYLQGLSSGDYSDLEMHAAVADDEPSYKKAYRETESLIAELSVKKSDFEKKWKDLWGTEKETPEQLRYLDDAITEIENMIEKNVNILKMLALEWEKDGAFEMPDVYHEGLFLEGKE